MNDDLKLQTARDVQHMLRIALVAYGQGELELFASQIHMCSQLLEHWYPRDSDES